MCDMTHACMWHDSLMCANIHFMNHEGATCFVKMLTRYSATWLTHMCDMTHPHMRLDSLMCVAWLTYVCGIFFYKSPNSHSFLTTIDKSHVWHESRMCVTWFTHMCDLTHSYVGHDSPICVTYDSLICVTWLTHACDMTLARGCGIHSRHGVAYWITHIYTHTYWLALTRTHARTHTHTHTHTGAAFIAGMVFLLSSATGAGNKQTALRARDDDEEDEWDDEEEDEWDILLMDGRDSYCS